LQCVYFPTKETLAKFEELKNGDKVEVGTLLVEVDLEKVKEEGYDIITPVIVSNSFDYGDVLAVTGQEVKAGDELLKVVK